MLHQKPDSFTAEPRPADPVIAQIELHKALAVRVNTMPDDDEAPAYKAACAEEEAAIQALGDMTPMTIAGAAAQLQYMADVEGYFATGGSPLLRTVQTVANALATRLVDGLSDVDPSNTLRAAAG